MTIEYDDKGKIFTDIVSKRTIFATVQTTTHLLRGQLHVRHDQRLKDELDREKKFLAMTDVSVLAPNGEVLYETAFLAVNRAHIIWVLPVQNNNEEDEA